MSSQFFRKGGFMGLDRVLVWDKIVPNKEQIEQLLEDYFNIPGYVSWDEGCFLIDIPGTNNSPARRVRPEFDHTVMYAPERWIEVSFEEESICITTRSQDEFLNDIAAGLTKRIKWIFEAKNEIEEEAD